MQFGSISDTQPFTVRGIIGKFTVVGSKWKICHFSTFASSENDSSAGNTSRLLHELKPMRERVKPAEIKDMSSLLQRDLDDSRVAHELIPYLLSNKASIGFFPAVLCALMPKRFLAPNGEGGKPVVYPDGQLEKDERNYSGYWKLRTYRADNGNDSAFAQLTIDPSKTDVIVLDGQHRSNAFRFLTKTFAADSREIYSHFYKDIKVPEQFDSELPVTIIWFEKLGDNPVDPKLISRRLFVDVNTTAKKVNDSRNILLNDQAFPSVCTAIFYSRLAQLGFDEGNFSLLHGAFDCDSEKNRSVLSLCSPTVIEYAFRCFCLGKADFDNLNVKIQKDYSEYQNNLDRLKRFFTNLEPKKKTSCTSDLSPTNPAIREAFGDTGAAYVYKLFSKFALSSLMIKASMQLAADIRSDGWRSTTRSEVWERVYCGGEGLFSSFVGSIDEAIQKGSYAQAIREIEDRFLEIRAGLLNEQDKQPVDKPIIARAFETFLSKASITGLVMAISKMHESLGWSFEISDEDGVKETVLTVDHFLDLLNYFTPKQWVAVFTDFKSKAVSKELNPRLWPSMRNLYLRVVEDRELAIRKDAISCQLNWFKGNFEGSPDFAYVQSSVKEKVSAFKKANNDDAPDRSQVKIYYSEAEKELGLILKRIGLNSIKPAKFRWVTKDNEFLHPDENKQLEPTEEDLDGQ